MTCSQDFIIPNSAFSLEERVCSRGFIIPNSDFLLPSSSCEYLHVCCNGLSEIIAVAISHLCPKELTK
jgi:hypothetical protein